MVNSTDLNHTTEYIFNYVDNKGKIIKKTIIGSFEDITDDDFYVFENLVVTLDNLKYVTDADKDKDLMTMDYQDPTQKNKWVRERELQKQQFQNKADKKEAIERMDEENARITREEYIQEDYQQLLKDIAESMATNDSGIVDETQLPNYIKYVQQYENGSVKNIEKIRKIQKLKGNNLNNFYIISLAKKMQEDIKSFVYKNNLFMDNNGKILNPYENLYEDEFNRRYLTGSYDKHIDYYLTHGNQMDNYVDDLVANWDEEKEARRKPLRKAQAKYPMQAQASESAQAQYPMQAQAQGFGVFGNFGNWASNTASNLGKSAANAVSVQLSRKRKDNSDAIEPSDNLGKVAREAQYISLTDVAGKAGRNVKRREEVPLFNFGGKRKSKRKPRRSRKQKKSRKQRR